MRTLARAAALAAILALMILGAAAQPPPDFKLNATAGSRGIFGEGEYLVIDSVGQVTFFKSAHDTTPPESVLVSIPMDSVAAIYDTVTAVGFGALDSLYRSELVDGSGIWLQVQANGSTHAVEVVNTSVPAVDQIARTINRILQPYGILLEYESSTDSFPE
jgi:hypothetical protein